MCRPSPAVLPQFLRPFTLVSVRGNGLTPDDCDPHLRPSLGSTSSLTPDAPRLGLTGGIRLPSRQRRRRTTPVAIPVAAPRFQVPRRCSTPCRTTSGPAGFVIQALVRHGEAEPVVAVAPSLVEFHRLPVRHPVVGQFHDPSARRPGRKNAKRGL
jgi:hypothetical protein